MNDKLSKKDFEDILALTPMQEGMLFHYLKDPSSSLYFEQLCLFLSGEMDIECFEKAWNVVIESNEMLRAVFRWEKVENPVQIVLKEHRLKLQYYDFSHLENSQIQEKLGEIKEIDRGKPFDLRQVPLRVYLCKTAGDRYAMIISNHHILYDGWSNGIILNEFLNTYNNILNERELVRPVKTSFKEFVKWIQNRDRNRQETFWKNYFSDIEFRPSFPVFAGKRGLNGEGEGNYRFNLSQDFENEITGFVKSKKVTTASLFYSAWGILLQRYLYSGDIVFGTTVSGRKAAMKGIEDMVGLFINTLPLRIKTLPNQGPLDLLQDVTRALEEREEYEWSSLTDINKYSEIKGTGDLFDSIVVIENYPLDKALMFTPNSNPRNLQIDSYSQEAHTNYDLTVGIQTFKGIEIIFSYNNGRYEDDFIRTMAGHFETVIRHLIQQPEIKIERVDILNTEEKKEILETVNNTGAEYPRDKTLHQLFQEQVKRTPDHIALHIPHTTHMSYTELNQKAQRLADVLIEKGVKPDTVVGIMVERSLEMAAGLLGILKAGGAYLPVEPDNPEDRINYMMSDSNVDLLVTTNSLSEKASIKTDTVTFDDLKDRGAPPPNKRHTSRPSNLAYVIYTSGTTGRPKGTAVNHGGVVNFTLWRLKAHDLCEKDVTLQLLSYAFDGFGSNFYSSLLSGGKLVFVPDSKKIEYEYIAAAARDCGVTNAALVPGIYEALVDRADSGVLENLRFVVLGGEKAGESLIKRGQSANPRLKHVIEYGPTEVSITATANIGIDAPSVGVIGKPIDNTRVYILDKFLGPVPFWVPGEIFIGGDGLARGYLNQPEQTAEKFSRGAAPIKRGAAPLSPLYRTGDLGRRLPGGNIEFLGRADHQVKIRGYRIELEEIEARLRTHHQVKEAVVLTKEAEQGDGFLCAYLVPYPPDAPPPDVSRLKSYFSQQMPDYMIPSFFIFIEKMPLTANGKVDREALPEVGDVRAREKETLVAPRTDIEQIIADAWKHVLKIEKVGVHDNFFDLGGNSLTLIRLNNKLKEGLKKDIPVVTLLNHPTVRAQAAYLEDGETPAGKTATDQKPGIPLTVERTGNEIAVIGMAGRFPGSKNLDEFWANVKDGVEAITFFTDEELELLGVEKKLLTRVNYVKAKGVLENQEYFDSDFFSYTVRETEMMDPQLRILHECVWEALEDAAYDPFTYRGGIGLYVGAFPGSWMKRLSSEITTHSEMVAVSSLNQLDYLGTRISYKLNLKGPALTVQTACSTSLVAIDAACQALWSGKCHMALAGGISITYLDNAGYLYEDGMVRSPDGHCRPFDAGAAGTVGGNGVGIVVLKPLEDARRAGDFIYAVIKGSAVNNDGMRKVGFTAPSIEGQADVIRAAHRTAGIGPETITYVEAHGTGTPLGDPVEIEALKQAFRTGETPKKQFCGLGAVKAGIGHLDAAAGAAGFIKTVLALRNRIIPPAVNFEKPNPKIDLKNSPFYINTTPLPWNNKEFPLRAGVSSFGIGGTNAHVVLEEAPERGVSPEGRKYKLVLLSAKTKTSLDRNSFNLARHLEKNPGLNPADAAYTLQVGRGSFNFRRIVVAQKAEDITDALSNPTGNPRVSTSVNEQDDRHIVFMFPGQGSQYVAMGLELYKTETVFRLEMDHCFKLLKPLVEYDLKNLLYNKSNKPDSEELNQTEIAQPVIFIIEYALAKLLMSWGIRPHAMIGHSIGEYIAACLAGVFSLEDALKLVARRGKLMQQMPTGAMLGVPLPEKELAPLLKPFPGISMAAVNSSSLCVVSGPHEAVDSLYRKLEKKQPGLTVTRLHTSHAFHSSMMDAMLAPFEENLRSITLNPPQLPYISNLTGEWITVENAVDPSYWVRHIRRPVRFARGLTLLLEDPKAVFVEIGPGRALSTFVKKHESFKENQPVVNLVRHPRDDVDDAYFLLQRLGQLWLSGVTVDWEGFYGNEPRFRVPLPTYAFDRKYFWKYGHKVREDVKDITDIKEKKIEKKAQTGKTDPGKRNPLKDWLYTTTWKPSQSPPPYHPSDVAAHRWLIFTDKSGLGEDLLNHIKQDGGEGYIVKIGSQFARLADGIYSLNPERPGDYENLFKSLTGDKKTPHRVVHLWNVVGDKEINNPDQFQYTGFYSMIYLAQAVGKLGITDEISVTMVTDNMQTTAPDEKNTGIYAPLRSTLLGACKVIPKEYPNLRCRSVDITLPPSTGQLLGELIAGENRNPLEPEVAYRGGVRWVRAFEPVSPETPTNVADMLKPRGVYLVTGGLGGIGLELAQYLAKQTRARLILTGRSVFPSPELWDRWVNEHGERDEVSRKIQKIKKMVDSGADVCVFQADVSDESRMRDVLEDTVRRLGPVNGVIHAAGIPEGGMIQAKTREAMEAVMAPKVKGTLVLDKLLSETNGETPPDFVIYCSSLASIMGAFGQVAYTAANVFLDYFARYKNARGGTTAVAAVNWDAWLDVGMAEKAEYRLQSREVEHPLFHRCRVKETGEIVFTSVFSVKEVWALKEHRIAGNHVLPGTAYLEMARAAFEHYMGDTAVEIRHAYFAAPLVIEASEERDVRTILKKHILKKQENPGYAGTVEFSFSISSREGGDTSQWLEHAGGKLAALETGESPEPQRYEPARLTAGCREDETAKIEISHFGPRWSDMIIEKVRYGENRRTAMLELHHPFAGEVSTYKLHPALLDLAVSFLDERIKQGQSYVPFSYKGIKVYRPLPHRVFSEVNRLDFPSEDILSFSVRLMDEDGSVCVDIETFMIKRLDENIQNIQAVQPHANDDTRNLCLEMPSASAGNLEALELVPHPRKAPGPGEVEIEVAAAGLNFKEVLFALGMLPSPAATLSFGFECSGRICGLGEGVDEFQIGDPVMAFASPAFSRFLVTPTSTVARKPSQLGFEEAAAIPVAFLTAYYALITLGRLLEGERVLIHSAAGGVGLAAVKIAQWKGAEIFATAGNPEKREYLRSLGIKHVMDSRSVDFSDEVNEITGGKGVNVLLNSLAGEYIDKGFSVLAPYGRFLEIGVRDIAGNSQLGMRVFEKGISFFAVSAGREMPGFTDVFREMARHIENGDFGPLPIRRYPMDNAADALKYMAQARHIGKLVVTHPDRLKQRDEDGISREGELSGGLLPSEGTTVFARILQQAQQSAKSAASGDRPLSQVVVSTTDLTARVRTAYQTRKPGDDPRLETIAPAAGPGTVNPRPSLGTDYVPPGSELEKQVVSVWEEFLGLEKVGIHDNFFDLGVSSLDVIQVNNKLSTLLEKELSVVTFYTYPTVHSLVKHLEGESPETGEETASKEVKIEKSKKAFKNTLNKMRSKG